MRLIRGTNWKTKDSEKQRKKALEICENARAQLVLHHPFVGRLGIHIPFLPVVDSRVRTIATNGKVIYVRPEWLCRMPPVTTVAVIAHTIWTAALCHSFRRGEIDPVKFDAASDLEVYTLLCVEKVPMCLKPDFSDHFPKHLPVEKIAEQLPHGAMRSPDSDVHLYTAGIISLPPLPEDEKTEEMDKDEKKNKQNLSPKTTGNDQESGQSQQEREESKQRDEGTEEQTQKSQIPEAPFDGEVDTTCDPAMQEVWRQRIIEAGQHCKMLFGHLPGELEELVRSFKEVRINYLQLLRKYMGMISGGETHWLPPARRFVWQGLYLPSHTNPKMEIVVAVDTSGSIDEEQFQVVFGEINGIVKEFRNYELTLIQCDAKIHSVQKYSAAHPFQKDTPIEIQGRGGTDFCPVFDYIAKEKMRPKVLLYYTDGYGTYPDAPPHYPVIWLLQNGDPERIPWGKVIEIPKTKNNRKEVENEHI